MMHLSHVLRYQPMRLKVNLWFECDPVETLVGKDHVLMDKLRIIVKVLWKNHGREEATWEGEQQIKEKYPHLFQ